MRPSTRLSSARRGRLFGALAAVLLVLLSGSVLAIPARASGSLSVITMFLQTDPACLGEVVSIPVSAFGPNGIPVSGAAISVNGQQAGTTSASGSFLLQYAVRKDGKETLTIGASSKVYGAASTHLDVEGQQCGWNIRMDYKEEVRAANAFWIDSTLSFPNQAFVVNDDGTLALLNSSKITANYSSDIDNTEEAIAFHLDPPISGTAEIDFSGTYDSKNGVLLINLSSPTIALPGQVGIKVTDIQNLAPNLPDVTWGTLPFSDVVNLAKLHPWKASPTFDYKMFTLNKSAFYPEKLSLVYANGWIILERMQKSGN